MKWHMYFPSPYYHFTLVASDYNSGEYGSSTYSGQTLTSTGSSALQSGNGTLANTGIAVGPVLMLAAAILLIAIIVRFKKQPSRQVGLDRRDTQARCRARRLDHDASLASIPEHGRRARLQPRRSDDASSNGPRVDRTVVRAWARSRASMSRNAAESAAT